MKGLERIEHHGYSFAIDTMNWGAHREAASKAAGHLAEWITSLDPDATRRLHKALAEDDQSSLWIATLKTMGDMARDSVMSEDGWAELPDDEYGIIVSADGTHSA